MKKKLLFIAGVIFCFSIGAYTWKITHTGSRYGLTDRGDDGEVETIQNGQLPTVLAYVGKKPISSEDLDFEYSLHTNGVFDAEDLTPIPDLGSSYEKELAPLKERLMAGLIERKLLFQQVLKDKNFDYDKSSRYVECHKQWAETIKKSKNLVLEEPDRERLKARLCERSILMQYLEERLFPQIEVTEAEVIEYYKNHVNDFHLPQRYVIRQIVLASEKDAIQVRAGLNSSNFAERAKQYSITPEASEGGILGPFAKGEMPGIFDEVLTMRVGSIYGNMKSTYGFHLIMLEKKFPKVDLSLKEATPKIKAILRKKKEEEEYKKWVELAQSSFNIRMPSL